MSHFCDILQINIKLPKDDKKIGKKRTSFIVTEWYIKIRNTNVFYIHTQNKGDIVYKLKKVERKIDIIKYLDINLDK